MSRGRGCAVCAHHNVSKIDEQLRKNVPVRVIARRLGSSASALSRHRKHLRASLKAATAETIIEANYSPTLLDQLQ